ncbi:MAG: GNAT family N-acetyltransferase [Dehalococcoidia bacterium]|nr:MAG: GNAT family N-acetyltransferase [Dehalococcoidia bacterium]
MFGRRLVKRADSQAEVRLAVAEDWQGFLVLAGAMYQEFEEEGPPGQRLMELFDRALAPDSPFKLFFAVEGGELCGMLSLAIAPTTQEAGCFAYLDDLFVLEHYRGQGIGTKLMREALNHARRSGCIRVELGTRRDNIRARRLYERLGFREVDGVRYWLMLR